MSGMTRVDSYNNWIVIGKVERYKYVRKQLKIQVDIFEKSDPCRIIELEEYILKAYWGNVEDLGGSDIQPPDLAKLLNLADPDWEFARILFIIHHYMSLIINTTPKALPILKEEFYHMVDTIKQAVCEIRQTEKADFDPLNKFELADGAIEHFSELTKTPSKLLIMTTETNSDSKAASEAAEKLAGIAEGIASEVYFDGSCERIVNPSVLDVFLNESTRSPYHILMNHLLFKGDIDSIDEIGYIHDQARDVILRTLSHHKIENGDISIMAPEIHDLLTQLAAALLKVKHNNGESEINSRCPEPHDVIDKLGRLATSRQLAETYDLNEKRVRVKLNRAANKNRKLRKKKDNPQARSPQFDYVTERAIPHMEELWEYYKKKAGRNP